MGLLKSHCRFLHSFHSWKNITTRLYMSHFSVKEMTIDFVHWFGTSAIFFFKMANLKKNQGRFHGCRTVFFLCVFVLGTVQGRNGEWRGFLSFLKYHLLEAPLRWKVSHQENKKKSKPSSYLLQCLVEMIFI